MAAPIPPNEAERLARLRDMVVLDTEPEAVFDSLAQLASQLCGAPIALMSLIDSERQWFKANVGLPGVNETPRDVAFCAYAIESDALLEVTDATQDRRFADNPLVLGAPDIRFYAGAPLVLSDGARIGTLCVIDREARRLTPEQRRQLLALARIAVQTLEMRRGLIERSLQVRSEHEKQLAQSEARHRAILDAHTELVSQARADGTLTYVNPAYAQHFKRDVASMLGTNLFDYIEPADRSLVRQRIDWVLSTGTTLNAENRMSNHTGDDQWFAWTNTRQFDAEGQPLLHSVGRDVSARMRAENALRDSESFLRRTGRVAGVGGWQLDLLTNALTWSEQTRAIHEVAPDYVPTLDSAIQFYAPDAQAAISGAVQEAITSGTAWDLELPFITAKGRSAWVRAQGEAEFHDGAAVRLVGALQDITERKRLEQERSELTAIIENTTDYVVQTDWRGRISYMNPAARAALGLADDAPVVGRNVSEFNTESTQRRLAEVILPAASIAGVWVGETTAFAAGRREVAVSHMVIAHKDRSGRVMRYSGVMRDISDATHARQAMLMQTATLRAVTEAIPAIVAVVGADGRYRLVNGAFERWIGMPRHQVVGRSLAQVLGPEDMARSQPWVERVLAGETVQFERVNLKRNRGGRNLMMSYTPLMLDGGVIDGFIGVGQDITTHRQEESRLLTLSERDPLTGLLNRAGFERRIERELQEGRGAQLGLLYVDLDHFKPVNDRYGHPAGDDVLKQFAQRMQAAVRPTDLVARLGGDEFAILLFGLREVTHAHLVASKVIAAAGAPFMATGHRVSIGASVGVALGRHGDTDWHDLVARADNQLYRAKQAGRGRQAGVTDWMPDVPGSGPAD